MVFAGMWVRSNMQLREIRTLLRRGDKYENTQAVELDVGCELSARSAVFNCREGAGERAGPAVSESGSKPSGPESAGSESGSEPARWSRSRSGSEPGSSGTRGSAGLFARIDLFSSRRRG